MHTTAKEPKVSKAVHHLTQINLFELTPETHGTLCGFLCAGLQTDGKAWLESLVATIEADGFNNRPSRTTLIELYNYILIQFIELRFELHPSLATREEDLTSRAEALSNWCYGFLLGLQQTGLDISKSTIEDFQEIYFRFSEIATINYGEVDICPEDELAFSEVLNFIHTSVLHIYQEITKKGHTQLH